MRLHLKSVVPAVCLLAACVCLQSCAELGQILQALSNLKRLQFRLDGITEFSLLDIPLSRKAALTDFSVSDGLKLVAGFSGKRLPAEFLVNIEVRNPNDGTGGSPQTVSTLTSLESRLLIDDVPTIVADIDRAIEIPGTGQAAVIPIRMSLDLYEFFAEKGYEGLIHLALALGGAGRDAARISLDAQPTVETPLGPITYPGRIVIVNTEFR